MRRRHEAIIRSGALARLRSEGRLVFALALCWADYKTCQFRFSARGAAKMAGVQPTAVRRGLAQLLEVGVIEAGPAEDGKRLKYRFRTPQKSAHGSCAGGTHPVPPPGHTPCAPPDTGGAQGAHGVCAGRAPGVSSARTACVPYSSIILKDSSRNPQGAGSPGGLPAAQLRIAEEP